MNILANVCVFPTKLELDLFLFHQLLVQQFLHTHSHRVTRLKCNWNVSFIYAYTNMHKIGENISEMLFLFAALL